MDHLLHAQGPTRIRQSSTDDKAKILPCEIENVFFRYIELLPAQNLTTSTFLRVTFFLAYTKVWNGKIPEFDKSP